MPSTFIQTNLKVFFSIKKAYCISVRAYDASIEVKDQTNEGRNTTGD